MDREVASYEQGLMVDSPNNPWVGDEALFVEFSVRVVPDADESVERGIPVHVEREYISIYVPGDKNNQPIRPVTDVERKRFATKYAAWKANQDAEQKMGGIPLEHCGFMTRPEAADYRAMKIFTVEQLATVSPEKLPGVPGLTGKKQQAIDYLDRSKASAQANAMRAELKERDETIAGMKEQLERLAGKLAQIEVERHEAEARPPPLASQQQRRRE